MSVSHKTGWVARLLFHTPLCLPSPSIPTLSGLCPSYWFGTWQSWHRFLPWGWQTGFGTGTQGLERGAGQMKGWSGSLRGGGRGPWKCLGHNLTQTFSTSILRVGFQKPEKEFNLFCWFFFYKLGTPAKNSKFWAENVPIFTTVKFLYWLFSYSLPPHTTM